MIFIVLVLLAVGLVLLVLATNSAASWVRKSVAAAAVLLGLLIATLGISMFAPEALGGRLAGLGRRGDPCDPGAKRFKALLQDPAVELRPPGTDLVTRTVDVSGGDVFYNNCDDATVWLTFRPNNPDLGPLFAYSKAKLRRMGWTETSGSKADSRDVYSPIEMTNYIGDFPAYVKIHGSRADQPPAFHLFFGIEPQVGHFDD